MVISPHASTVLMPKIDRPYPSLLDFLTHRFPNIDRETWRTRIQSGKVLTGQGTPICLDTPYEPLKRLHYFREKEAELVIPFTEQILFCNQELLVACKPHFLPVTPGGTWVNECLLHRLKKTTQNRELSPIHRIDRETAGLVLFSMNPKTRGRYQALFMTHGVEKTYEAVAPYSGEPEKKSWTVENRIIQGEPWFRMKTAPGKPNARSFITLVASKNDRALFHLSPLTGKKHQLRLHLSGLGFPILNDPYYPHLLPEKKGDFSAPLQLLARKIQFQDPVTGSWMTYESPRRLDL